MKSLTGRVLSVLALMVAVCGCPEIKDLAKDVFTEPQVRVRAVNITDISLKEIGLAFGLEVENPNPIGIELAGLDYDLALAGHPLVRGDFGSGLKIQAAGVSPAVVPVTLAFEEINRIYEATKAEDYLPYILSGQVKLETPIGVIPIPYQARGKLPVVRPPEIQNVAVDFKQFSISGIEAVIKIKMKNPNVFDLAAREIGYLLQLEGRDFASGSIRDQKISPKQSGYFNINTKLDFGAMGSWLTTLISKGSAKYQLDYRATYLIDDQPVRQKELNQGVLKL